MRCLLPLCVVLVLGCGAAEEKVLAQIREAGGAVTLARSEAFGAQQVYIEIKGEKGDKELERVAPHLKKLRRITGLHMHGSAVTDEGLAHLKDLNNINHIVLENTGVTDKALDKLQHMTNLRYLDVTGTHVTDEGIAALKRALANLEIEKLAPAQAKAKEEIHKSGGQTVYAGRSLEEISFQHSHPGRDRRFNDSDLKNLKESLEAWKATLKKLDLSNTEVTDAALVHLKGLSNLQELVLTGTKVTDDGIKTLQRDHSQLKIRR